MSIVAHRAFAQLPSEGDFEGLTQRLLALRAEIDAILAKLATHATTMSQVAALMKEPMPALAASTAEPAAAIEPEMLSVPSAPADGEPMPETGAMVAAEAVLEPGAEATEPGAPTEMVDVPEMLAAPADDQPPASGSPEPVEAEPHTHAWTEPTAEQATPMALDADAAERARDAGPTGEAEIAPAAEIAAPEAVSAEPDLDAAVLEATQPPAPPAESEEPLPVPMDIAPAAADAAQTADSSAMPASATIVSLGARQKKHKGGIVIGPPARARSGRFLAAKIAAGILVLLTAATLLLIADRSAMGSVPSLNWMPPTPSVPSGIEWLLQRLKVDATESPANAAAYPLPLGDPVAILAWGP